MEAASDEQETLISLFLEIAIGHSVQTARQFLQATSWNLEQAIQLFFVAPPEPTHSFSNHQHQQHNQPAAAVWESEEHEASSAAPLEDNLATLYRPPVALTFRGNFERAKDHARKENKWLLMNVQSTTEFSSHMLNRDTWANETVSQTIKASFVFWQVYDDSEEGRKVCTYYRLGSIPVVLLIDPITGQNMRTWHGMVQPENLLEDLLQFMDRSPSDHHASLSRKRPGRESPKPTTPDVHNSTAGQVLDEELQQALAASMANTAIGVEQKVKRRDYLPLPEEPQGGDRSLVCRVGVRLPDGRRVQRNFLRTDPIQLLWSFCFSELKEEEERSRPFRLTHAIPGASKSLDYENQSTFQESGLSNSMISLTLI